MLRDNTMLRHLNIINFAIIDHLSLDFGSGLNAITGETGAGKSIIIGAISLICGNRAGPELIRKGCSEATIEALFEIAENRSPAAILAESGLPDEGNELVIRRVLRSSGRGRISVNGALCTLGTLTKITKTLLEMNSQHESRSLRERAYQRAILDLFADNHRLVNQMNAIYSSLQEQARVLRTTKQHESARRQRLDFLAYQLDELNSAPIGVETEEALEQERNRLALSDRLLTAAQKSEYVLYSGEDAITDKLAGLSRNLDALAPHDPELQPLAVQVAEAKVILDDAAQGFARYAGKIERDPETLGDLEQRIDLLRRLARKHSTSIDALSEEREKIQNEITALGEHDEQMSNRAACYEKDTQRAKEIATDLNRRRKDAAETVENDTTVHLAALQMPDARLSIDVGTLETHTGEDAIVILDSDGPRRIEAHGGDRIEFQVALNKGGDLQPLSRVASGGELSRLLLALSHTLGRHFPVATSIFDEIDSGVSGSIADAIGASLAAVAKSRQLIVITHLPQVAAYANQHFYVDKIDATGASDSPEAKRDAQGLAVRTRIVELDEPARITELARMLAASEISDEALANAQNLLQRAQATY